MKNWTKWIVVCTLMFLLPGCGNNPGQWGEEQVKAKIIESLEMDDLTLTANDGGGFTGTGKRGEETLTIKIDQDPEASRLSWDAQGDRGFIEEGFYELK